MSLGACRGDRAARGTQSRCAAGCLHAHANRPKALPGINPGSAVHNSRLLRRGMAGPENVARTEVWSKASEQA